MGTGSHSTLLRIWRASFFGCLAAVLVLSLLPGEVRLPDTGWDKSNHLIAFAALAITGLNTYPQRPSQLLLGLLAFGGLVEALQSFTPSRSAEWLDLLADAVGLLLGWVVWRWGAGVCSYVCSGLVNRDKG
jgi:VanZ family protein